ncbi:MAG TPA: MlaD family protein [Planctomycetota bacterium]
MSAQVRYVRLGMFVLVSAAIAAGAVVVFGAGNILRGKFLVESYIDESVQGLDGGASVKFRGVQVGRVESIGFARSKYGVDDTRVRVVIALSPDDASSLGKGDPAQVFKEFVDRGLRARVASQGLTGGTYIELDMLDPEKHPPPSHTWAPEHPVLPSVPSTGNRLMASAESFLVRLEKVKIDELVERVIGLAEEVGKSLKPVTDDARAFVAEATALTKDVRKELAGETVKELRAAIRALADLLEKDVAPTLAKIRETAAAAPPALQKAEAVLVRLDGTLARIDRTVAGTGAQGEATMENLRVATQDLRELMGTLKRYPASAVFGEPPPRARLVEK